MNMDRYQESSDDWVLLEEGSLQGVQLMVERTTGKIIKMSTQTTQDTDRFVEMPSLQGYTDLRTLDLHNSRYIKCLHDSVGKLASLEQLYLTSCNSLERLPSTIGNLANLTELVLMDSPNIRELPDSISNLKK